MKTITYNLREGQNNSNGYYHTIQQFSTLVFDKISRKLGDTLAGLINFIETRKIEKTRTEAEYAVEILTLGMSWDRYLGASQRTSKFTVKLLSILYQLRSKNQKLKPTVDRLRGFLTSTFVIGKINKKPRNANFSLYNFRRLIKWLEATGEFKDEVKRLKVWYMYFETNAIFGQIYEMKTILDVFNWFRSLSKSVLGKYTENIDQFLQNDYPGYKYREDVIFCGKQEVEYHLNMVGAEIINRGFKPEYDKTNKKVLLVPGCMRINNGENCKSKQVGLDISCTHCNKKCRINQLTEVGKQNDFRVFIVPHSSSFTKWLKKWENSRETGLVAAACILNLVAGGYEMRELNIPSQCVLLDFCGCQKHWDKKGIETDINQEHLLEIVNN